MTRQSYLEHANVTVSDPKATAAMLHDVFGWKTRWEGGSIHNGFSVHVGSDDSYLALYTPPKKEAVETNSYTRVGGLNHLAMVVENLDATEARVKAAGFETHSHADYEPGRRFYFHDRDGIEFEVVEYQ